MRRRILLALGTAVVAVASLLASDWAWVEAVSGSFVPYGAVPLVVGYVSSRSGMMMAALWGAGSNAVLVVVFYLVRPVLDPPYGAQWVDLFYGAAIGVVAGAVLAAIAWWLRPRASSNEARWAVGAWILLVVVQMAAFLYSGWGRIDVATGSGSVTIGYRTTDIVAASMVLAAFHGLLILVAVPGLEELEVGKRSPRLDVAGPAHGRRRIDDGQPDGR